MCDFWKKVIFEQICCVKYIFDISELVIHCNTISCCEHIIDGVNVYLHGCQSIGPSMCCLGMSVCDQIKVLAGLMSFV